MKKLNQLFQWSLTIWLIVFQSQGMAQDICPAYPRQADEIFVCFDEHEEYGKYFPTFAQRVAMHNPVRFRFGTLPAGSSIYKLDFQDGAGYRLISSNMEILINYPAPSTPDGEISIKSASTHDFPLPIGQTTLVKSHRFQLRFNPAFTSVPAPDEVWTDIVGDSYTPPSSNAYPAGSPYKQSTVGGVLSV